MNDRFGLAVDGLFAHPLDGAKDHFGAVERGDGQEIEYGQVHADEGRDLQKVLQPAQRHFGRDADGGHGPAERGQAEVARQQLPQDLEDGAADARRIGKGAAERFPKPEAAVRRRVDEVAAVLLGDAQAPPHRRVVGQVFKRGVGAQHHWHLDDGAARVRAAREGEAHHVPRAAAFERVHQVGRQVDVFPFAGDDHVLVLQRTGGLQPAFGRGDAVRHQQHLPAGKEGDGQQHERQQIVHQRPRQQHQDAPPRLFVVERGGVGVLGVLSREGAEPAQREGAQ